MRRISIVFLLIFASYFAGIEAYRYTSSSTAITGTLISSSPYGRCECLDVRRLQNNLNMILSKVEKLPKQMTNLTELPKIFTKLLEIQQTVQDKTCRCENGARLLELEEKTNSKVNDVFRLADESARCACDINNTFDVITKEILDGLKTIMNRSDIIQSIVKTCQQEFTEIKKKLDVLIDNGSGSSPCDMSQLEQDMLKMMALLKEILRLLYEILNRECGCKEEIAKMSEKICEKIELLMKKINDSTEQSNKKLDSLKELLENMNKKLDKIIEKDTTMITQECNCITYNQFIQVLPLYCVKQQRETKVESWELSEKATDELLSDYESCIKVAIHDLDDWFKAGTWNKMPESVKKIMITIYCKMGLKDMHFFFQSRSKIKEKLEARNWKEAADLMSQTLWAKKRDPDAAKELIKKLREVGQ